MNEKYGAILRQARENADLSVEEVSVKLSALGFKVSPKTLYGYENDVSTPKISLFMTMCKLYRVTDIYSTFHMRDNSEPTQLVLSSHERQVILSYRAHPAAQPFVDKLLELSPEVVSQPKQA